jgi:hypothetical protein
VTSKTPFTQPIGKSDTAEWGTSRRASPDHLCIATPGLGRVAIKVPKPGGSCMHDLRH